MDRQFTATGSYCDAGGVAVADPCNVATVVGNTCGVAGTNDTGTASIFSATSPVDGGTSAYNLTIIAMNNNGTTFTLQATPVNAQVGNGNLQLTSIGVRRWDRNADCDYVDTNETSWD
jgi:type IV pilus assembly protein PilE